MKPNTNPKDNFMEMQSEQVNELFKALSRAQGQLKAAVKDSKNPFYKSYYADLNSVFDACRDQLAQNDLCISQTMHFQDGQHFLITTLGHSSGQWLKSMAPIIVKAEKIDAQSFGSAVTYQRRYALSAIVGVSTEVDDDGNNAVSKAHQKPEEAPKPKEVSKPLDPLSENQKEELKVLWEQCPEDIKENVKSSLKKINVKKVSEMPASSFDFFKNLMLNHSNIQLTEGLNK